MDTAQTTLPDLDLLDHEARKALVREQHTQLLSQEAEIEHLKLLLAKLQRQQFGRKSERVERQIEQLAQRLEDLETSQVERLSAEKSETVAAVASPRRPARKPLPAHLPRETCPACGGVLWPLGEDVSEIDPIPKNSARANWSTLRQTKSLLPMRRTEECRKKGTAQNRLFRL